MIFDMNWIDGCKKIVKTWEEVMVWIASPQEPENIALTVQSHTHKATDSTIVIWS